MILTLAELLQDDCDALADDDHVLLQDVDVDLQDVDVGLALIKVLGKRNKERFIPLSPQILGVLEEYTRVKTQQYEGNRSSPFFVTDKGDKMYPKFVYRIVNKYLSKVTTVVRKSPHVLRHTFATHMLNNGADLNAIKELLGHANLSATQVYTHNTIDRLKNIHKRAHPKA